MIFVLNQDRRLPPDAHRRDDLWVAEVDDGRDEVCYASDELGIDEHYYKLVPSEGEEDGVPVMEEPVMTEGPSWFDMLLIALSALLILIALVLAVYMVVGGLLPSSEPASMAAESAASASYEYHLENVSGEDSGVVERDSDSSLKCPGCGSTTLTANLGVTDVVTCSECGEKYRIVSRVVE